MLASRKSEAKPGLTGEDYQQVWPANNQLIQGSAVLIIPFQKLSREALRGVIEEFVTRDGTDYEFAETDLEQKIDKVLRQLRTGDVFIVYDEAAETTNILPKEDVVKMKSG